MISTPDSISCAPEIQARSPGLRDTILLQCVATLLIANSHLEPLYPRSWMAADGLLGNSIFFFLSGYGLMCSEQRQSRPFLQYYLRRIVRIFPVLWITVTLFQILLPFVAPGTLTAISGSEHLGAGWLLQHLVYPTGYGYIQQILVFYVLFYFLARAHRPRILLLFAGLLCVPYAWLYCRDLHFTTAEHLQLGRLSPGMWWIYFFQVMLLGGWMTSRKENPWLQKPVICAALLALCFVAYVGLKFAMVLGLRLPMTGGFLAHYYFLLHWAVIAQVILGFFLATHSAVLGAIKRVSPAYWLVSLAGGLTLEIYLVHVFVIESPQVRALVFPINVLVFYAISLALSYGVRLAAAWVTEMVTVRRKTGASVPQ